MGRSWALLPEPPGWDPSSAPDYFSGQRVFFPSLHPSVLLDTADNPKIPAGERDSMFATCLAQCSVSDSQPRPPHPSTFPSNFFNIEQWLLTNTDFCSLRDSSEKAMAPHSSTLAWKIPWTEEPGGLQSMGSLRVRHD